MPRNDTLSETRNFRTLIRSLFFFFLKVNKTTSESETVNQNENHFDGGSFRGGALTVMERVGGGVLDVR